MIKKMRTNEGIQYKKLSPEEMKARGILGRLIGPCADFNNATRNGRKYSEQLWENVFNDPIMQEKIANGVCFGELGHPEDRTEIDMEKIAVCLREQPVKNEKGQLCACFDILDTPNGRILKTLCDYGSTVGVSSRGQGDLITDDDGNEAVDPDTYECECWDIVLVPAVKEARMQYVKEGLDTKAIKMKKALSESLNTATEEEKKIMEETLSNLKININESEENEINDDFEIAAAGEEAGLEDVTLDLPADENPESEDVPAIEGEPVPELDPDLGEEPAAEEEAGDDEEEEIDDRTDEEVFYDYLLANFDEKAVKKACKALDIEMPEIEDGEAEDESEEDKSEAEEEMPEEGNEEDSNDESQENIDAEDEEAKEEADEVNEAIDDGSEALVASLQEALKSKSDLESSVKSLQEKLAASDVRVNELVEECNRYKSAIARLSTLAKSTKDLKESVSKLEESLTVKDSTIAEQKAAIEKLESEGKASTALTESVNAKDAKISSLSDEVKSLTEQLKTSKNDSANQIAELNESLTKATSLKESYKKLATKAVNKYIDQKANMIGLTAADIKRKLGESYTIEDVDQVCEELKSYQLNVSRLPFSVDRKVGIRVNESAPKRPSPKMDDDDEVSSSLIRLANLD